VVRLFVCLSVCLRLSVCRRRRYLYPLLNKDG